MTLPTFEKQSKALDQWLNKIQISENIIERQSRKPEFRVSSLPYCPILFLDSLARFYEEAATKSYSMRFYTEIGTAVHEAFQEFGKPVHPKTFFGNWKCTRVLSKKIKDDACIEKKCAKVEKKITSFDKLKVKCPHGYKDCKDYFEYEEILFLWNGLSGHLDCLAKIEGEWWILDWKTTGPKLFDVKERAGAIKRGYYPSAKYIEQIESYAVLLKLLYDIDIKYYAITYVSRNAPSDPKWKREGHYNFIVKMNPKRFKRRLAKLKRQAKAHEILTKLLRKTTDKNLDAICEIKPCHSSEDFEKEMKPAFFGKEVCPYLDDGTCMKPKKLKKHLREMLDYVREEQNDSE